MKILKPAPRYKCDFCKRTYIVRQACVEHENKCFFNPNRNCPTCSNEGVEMLAILGANLGVIPDGDERDCLPCMIAEQHGGKSYRSEELQEKARKEREANETVYPY
jgi:hypothetical protein